MNLVALSSRRLQTRLSSEAGMPTLPALGPQRGVGQPEPAACQGEGGSTPTSQPSATRGREGVGGKCIHQETQGENKQAE